MLTLEKIQQSAAEIGKKYGVKRIYLFGSYARGQATEKSDVDFRIDSGRIKDYFELGGFYAELKNSLGKEIDVVTTASLRPNFLAQIKQDEVLIYGA